MSLVDDEIVWPSPVSLWIVHHDVDENRQKPSEHSFSIPDLVAVHIAVPGGSAMHELISQDIETIENRREDEGGVPLSQCRTH